MAERKPRATKEEALNNKIQKAAEAKAKLQAKIEALEKEAAAYEQQLHDLHDDKRKAEKAALKAVENKARKDAEKAILQAIKKTGLSVDEVKEKLGL